MFRRKHQHYTPVPGLQGPPGPKGDLGPTGDAGRDWTHLVATWEPLPDTDLDRFPEPAAAHIGDAAVDLQTTHRVVLDPHTTVDAHTGWRVHLKPDTSGEVLSRTGLSGRGIIVANSPGLVDLGYTGEVIVRLHNLSDRRVVLEAGNRVAQFRVVPTVIPLSYVGQPERGDAGLGSTGLSGPQHWAENDHGVSVVPGPEALDTESEAPRTYARYAQVGEDPAGNPVWAKVTDTGVAWSNNPEGLRTAVADLDETATQLAEVSEVPEVDMVNHPAHYENHPIFPGECWEYTKWLTPAQYAAAKYLWRYNAKGDPAENLRKALWYLVRAEDGFDTPMMVNLPDVPGGVDLYRELDAALTTAEVGVLRGEVDLPVSDLYAGMAFLHTIRGQIDAAMSSTKSALNHLD